MIYIYATEGYAKWAYIFVESFALFHKKEKIWLSGCNLTDKTIKNISKLYNNLIIDNNNLSIEDMSKKFNVPVNTILKSKKNCEGNKKSGNSHRLWMNIQADGLRIENFYDAILKNPNEKYYLFLDIDMLVRKNLNSFIKEMNKADICLKIRHWKKRDDSNIGKSFLSLNNKWGKNDRSINISTVFIKNNENGITFVKNWVNAVNSAPMIDRDNVKWGQHAVVIAYNKSIKNAEIHRIYPLFSDGKRRKNSPIWFFKKKDKLNDYNIAKIELKNIKKEII